MPPKAREFRTLEHLRDYYAIRLSRTELEPSELARRQQQAELMAEREASIEALVKRLEVMQPTTVVFEPPIPAPAASTADSEDAAEKFYGAYIPIGGHLRRSALTKTTEPEAT